MTSYKKREEEKNRRREEIAKKYPMTNPRSNVTAILTKKEQQVSPQIKKTVDTWKERGAVSAVNSRSKVENYPLKITPGVKRDSDVWSGIAQSGNRLQTMIEYPDRKQNREFGNKAATGWQAFRIDEANKRLSRAEPALQRWKERFGEDDFDDALYKPAINWSVNDNNTFGYLYNDNKEDAYRFARTLNKAYRKREEETALQKSGGLEAKRAEAGLETATTVADWLKGLNLGEKLKDFGQDTLQRYGEAQESYGEAQKQQSTNTANGAKWLWEQHKTNASSLANAQAQQAKAQTEGLKETGNSEIAKKAMQHFSESMRRHSSNAETVAKQWEDGAYLSGKYSGVTGSDQTGASIHGLRDDTSYKTPNDEWTSGEKKLYEYHMKNNPQEAEAYAIRTNNRHNQKAHDAEMQEIEDGTSKNGGLAAIGARAANLVSFLEGYNQNLERAAIGRNNISRNALPSEIKEIVDETNKRNISEKHGGFAGDVYEFGTEVADALIAKKTWGQKIGKRKKVDVGDVFSIIGAFAEGYQGNSEGSSTGHAIWNGLKDAGVEIIGNVVSDQVEKKIPVENETIKSVIGEATGVGMTNLIVGSKEWFHQYESAINDLAKHYMATQNINERTARWKATKEFLEKSIK